MLNIKAKIRLRLSRGNLSFRGFSLLEMLVVLVIASTLTAIAVPYFWGGYAGTELKGSARTVASVLRTAKSYAETYNKRYYVVFDIPSLNILEMTLYKESVSPGNEIGKKEKLSLGASIQFNVSFVGNTALFTPYGTSNGGTVRIENTKKSKSIDVTVLSNTARIKVKDLN